ncbi:MAG TPA: ABC transporter permease [Stellaceae bacterium]|jgi:NitT/TauT family transport system permease protein|nr:ABC transporter permease [Stellaceae bacterium]
MKLGRYRGALIPVVLIALWEIGARTGVLPHDTMSQPSEVAVAGWDALLDGSLLIATAQTFQTALLGLALGSIIGIVLGAFIGLSPTLESIVGPTLDTVRPIPAVALIPLALLIYGFGVRMEVLVITYATVWPVLIVTISAVRGIEPRLLEVARTLEMPPLSRVRRIVLPAALARIAVGIRVSAGVALVVAVTVEIVLNPQGLGYGMIIAAQSLRPELMWAELLWVGFAGWAFNTLLLLIDRRWLRHYQPGGAR